MNVVPCDETGNEDLNEDLLTDEPNDLINTALDFKVKISQLFNLPEDLCRDIYCEYQFYMEKETYQTEVCKGSNRSPIFNFEKQHHVECVTKYLVDYLLQNQLVIKIYGTQELKNKKKPAQPKGKTSQITSRPSRTNMSSTMPGANSTMNSSMSSVKSNDSVKI